MIVHQQIPTTKYHWQYQQQGMYLSQGRTTTLQSCLPAIIFQSDCVRCSYYILSFVIFRGYRRQDENYSQCQHRIPCVGIWGSDSKAIHDSFLSNSPITIDGSVAVFGEYVRNLGAHWNPDSCVRAV
jgi:hypothetical protein